MTVTKATRDVLDLATRPVTNLQCTGGNIDGTAIGSTTPSTGKFTNIHADSIVLNNSGTLDVPGSGVSIIGTIYAYYAADLAECYESDADYPLGTVVAHGGDKEITIAKRGDQAFSVISTNPAYVLNGAPVEDKIMLPVAMVGRAQVRVIGPVKRHQILVLSETPGVAMGADLLSMSPMLGRALHDVDVEAGVESSVEAVIRYHV